MAAESEGLRLHLSSSNGTGYKGVFKDTSKPTVRFRAGHSVAGKTVSLGSFGTAVEAAVAYARAVGQAPDSAVEAAAEAEAAERAAERAAEAEAAERAAPALAEAEGLCLHLSSSNGTGYKGVFKDTSKPTVRFRAGHSVAGKTVSLGSFGTAVEAAVAYARSVAGEAPEPQARALCPTVVAEAEGLQLHLSDKTSTGYMGVRDETGRFRAERSHVHLGYFDTALEAAVAYARAVGQEKAEASRGGKKRGGKERSGGGGGGASAAAASEGGGKRRKARSSLHEASASDLFESRFSPLGSPSLRLAPAVRAAFDSLPAHEQARLAAFLPGPDREPAAWAQALRSEALAQAVDCWQERTARPLARLLPRPASLSPLPPVEPTPPPRCLQGHLAAGEFDPTVEDVLRVRRASALRKAERTQQLHLERLRQAVGAEGGAGLARCLSEAATSASGAGTEPDPAPPAEPEAAGVEAAALPRLCAATFLMPPAPLQPVEREVSERAAAPVVTERPPQEGAEFAMRNAPSLWLLGAVAASFQAGEPGEPDEVADAD